jgi:DNA-directed RNA polymerase specialized sigma24 family protein
MTPTWSRRCWPATRGIRSAACALAASVLGLCRRLLHQGPLAEDVAQEAAVAAVLGLPRLADPARFGAWLHVIAANRARMALRGRHRLALDGLLPLRGRGTARGRVRPTQEDAWSSREIHEAIMGGPAGAAARHPRRGHRRLPTGLQLPTAGRAAGHTTEHRVGPALPRAAPAPANASTAGRRAADAGPDPTRGAQDGHHGPDRRQRRLRRASGVRHRLRGHAAGAGRPRQLALELVGTPTRLPADAWDVAVGAGSVWAISSTDA